MDFDTIDIHEFIFFDKISDVKTRENDKYFILKHIINRGTDMHINDMVQEINNSTNENGNIDDTFIETYDRYKLLCKLQVNIDDINTFFTTQLNGFIKSLSFNTRIESLRIMNDILQCNDFKINDVNKGIIVRDILFNYKVWCFNHRYNQCMMDSIDIQLLHIQLDLLFKNISRVVF